RKAPSRNSSVSGIPQTHGKIWRKSRSDPEHCHPLALVLPSSLAIYVLGEQDRAKDTRVIPELRRHYIIFNVFDQEAFWNVAVKHRSQSLANHRKQEFSLHNAAAHNDSLWRKRANPGGESKSQVVSLQDPCRVIRRQIRRGLWPSF